MREKLIVQTDESNYWATKNVLYVWLIYSCMCVIGSYGYLYAAGIVIAFAGVYCACHWIGGGRKFVMDKEGCTIYFWFFKRKYKWEELQTKRYARYQKRFFSQRHPRFVRTGAEFSVKNMKEFSHTDAGTYAQFHPFTFFYVSFKDNYTESKNNTYLVDEEEFRALMDEWGVEMGEYKMGDFWEKFYGHKLN